TVLTEVPVADRDEASASAAMRGSSTRFPGTTIITKSTAAMPHTMMKRLLITNLPILSAPQECRHSATVLRAEHRWRHALGRHHREAGRWCQGFFLQHCALSPSACDEGRGEFGQAAGVAPFIIVPGQHFGHGAIEHFRGQGIHNSRMWIANDVH